MKAEKLFYSIGEMSKMLGVNTSTIRYWEKEFDILKPKKNKKGNRLFTPEDVRNLKEIHHLLKENGMTLKGAKQKLKNEHDRVSRDTELIERLKDIKNLLEDFKKELKS